MSILGLAVAASLGSGPVPTSQSCPFSVVGVWRLVSASSRTADGRVNHTPYGPAPSGILIYTSNGHMSVMISYSGRLPLSNGDRSAAPLEERAEAYSTFFGYSGRYTFLCDRVVHHVDIASVPNWVNVDMIRTVKFVGHGLTLSTPPRKLGGTESTFDLVWERSD